MLSSFTLTIVNRHVGVQMPPGERVPVIKWPSKLPWHLLNGHWTDAINMKRQGQAASVKPYIGIYFFLGLPTLMEHNKQRLLQTVNPLNHMPPLVVWKVVFQVFTVGSPQQIMCFMFPISSDAFSLSSCMEELCSF